MKGMIIFCILFFCSTMVLTAASPRRLKYKQILKKIEELETMVKDKDAELLHTPENPVMADSGSKGSTGSSVKEGCLHTAVTCFKKGVQKLNPVSSQANAEFTQAIRIVSKLTYRGSGECDSTCESYEKKTPKEFLKGFANLMQMLFKN